MNFLMKFTRSLQRPHNQDGVTLIELLAAVIITTMIGGIVLSILWTSASRATRLLTFNAAQRQLLLVNHALNTELHKADYVQIQTQSGASGKQVVLWLYSGGYVQNPNLTPAWLYNTTTVTQTPPANGTSAEEVVGSKCFGAFVFTQQPDSTWNIVYTTQVSPTGTACPSTVAASSLQGTSLLSESGIQVAWDFPNIYGDASGQIQNVNCEFVNSFVIRLSKTYQTSTGGSSTYYLTAGYHDKDVR
jgi:hypothetical protein